MRDWTAKYIFAKIARNCFGKVGVTLALSVAVGAIAVPSLFAAAQDSIAVAVQPRDIWAPATITDFVVTPNTEGSVVFTWTAPKEDDLPLPKMNPVFGYTIRWSTFSMQDVGNSSTTWYSNASGNLTLAGAQNPGQPEIDVASSLEPGATLYFVIASTDNAGHVSKLSPMTTALILDVAPGAPQALVASVNSNTNADLTWSAPAPVPSDLDYYEIFYSTQTPAVWVSTAIVPAGTLAYNVDWLNPALAYQFKVLSVDRGLPSYLGQALRSADSNIVSVSPGDLTPPADVLNLAALATSPTQGQLAWTAPGDDGFTGNNTSGSYDIRYSASPITDLTDFSLAASVSAFGTIPTPGIVSTVETLPLSGLTADATYYFALRTTDDAAQTSGLSNVAVLHMPDNVAPSAVSNFTVTANSAVGQRIDLAWQNPADADLSGMRILISTFSYSASTVAASNFTVVEVAPTQTFYAHTGLAVGVTYYYSIYAFDDAAARNYSSVQTGLAVVASGTLYPPAVVKGFSGTRSSDGESFVITWDPVTTRANGAALDPAELAGYEIFRMATLGGTTDQIFNRPGTPTNYTDTTIQKQVFYYKIRAVDTNGLASADSSMISSDLDNLTFLSLDDGLSYIVVPGDLYESLESSNLSINASRDEVSESGLVLKAINLKVLNVSGQEQKQFLFEKPIKFAIGYNVNGEGFVTSGAPSLSAPRAVPRTTQVKSDDASTALSIYWNSGANWIKLGSDTDLTDKTVSVQTRQTGSYQLRFVDQAQIQNNSVYPRVITPNGDGVNDIAFFFFENRTRANVQGQIYDMKSAKVSDLKLSDIFAGENSVLTWNGKNNADFVVTGGVYLYKIQIADQTFTGTIVVAR